MDPHSRSACCVCGTSDARTLVEVPLADGVNGAKAVLCGSHALMLQRIGTPARTEADLRAALGDRRGRRDRREEGDELGAALTAAFQSARRTGDRRSSSN
jgi:hypothetical protein